MPIGTTEIMDSVMEIPSLEVRFQQLGIGTEYPTDEKILQWVQGENREALRQCLKAGGGTLDDIAEFEEKLDEGRVLLQRDRLRF